MVIYDCENFEVIRRDGAPGLLLITFSSLGMFNAAGSLANGNVFWAQSLAEKFDYAAIGFVAKQRHWFCSPHMEAACATVAGIAGAYGQALAYGSSMGAYAALRWGRRSGAATAVAFAPQFSIDPAVVGSFDRRYEGAFRPDMHQGMEIRSEHLAPSPFLFIDPAVTPDRKHAELIHQNAPDVTEVQLHSCGHECIRAFARSELADRLLRLCAASDVEAVHALAREARKSSGIRPVELANRLVIRKTGVAKRIFTKYATRFEVAQKAAFLDRLREANRATSATPSTIGSIGPSAIATPSVPFVRGGRPSTLETGATPPMPEPTPRIVHLHIPKTAGTALRAAFQQQFQQRLRIFPYWNEARYADINPDDFDFYSGHIGFETASRLGGDIVTVLRHPVDRFVSVYYFWRQLHETGVEISVNTELAAKYTLDDFVRIRDQVGLIEEFQNRCTFQLAHGSSLAQRRHIRLQGLTDDAIFAMATGNLERFKAIGIQENLGRFADAIAAAFGVTLKIEKINVTRQRPDVASISLSTRRAIQDWVYMDLELYQQALWMA